MQIVLTAIIPVLLIMGLGWFLRRRSLQSATFWAGLDHLGYFIFTPALFVSTISQPPPTSVPLGGLPLRFAVPISGASGIIVLLRNPPRATGAGMGSSTPGTIRVNTYVGLIVANSRGGTQGMGLF